MCPESIWGLSNPADSIHRKAAACNVRSDEKTHRPVYSESSSTLRSRREFTKRLVLSELESNQNLPIRGPLRVAALSIVPRPTDVRRVWR